MSQIGKKFPLLPSRNLETKLKELLYSPATQETGAGGPHI